MTPPNLTFKPRRFIGFIIGIAILAAIWSLGGDLPWTEILTRTDFGQIVPVFFITHLLFVVSGIQMGMVAKHEFPAIKWSQVVIAGYVNQIVNIFLPTTLAELSFVSSFKNAGATLHTSTSSLAIAKIINGIIVCLFSLLLLCLLKENKQNVIAPALVLIVLCAPFIIIAVPPFRRFMRVTIEKMLPSTLGFFTSFSEFVRNFPSKTLQIFLLGIVRHLIGAWIAWAVINAMGGSMPFWAVTCATALGALAGIVSIIPGNLGLYEGMFVLVASYFGNDAQFILMTSLMVRFIGIISVFSAYPLLLLFQSRNKV